MSERIREIDLVKVKIYSDHCHSRVTTSLSITFTIFIGLWILGCTLFFQRIILPEIWYFVIIVLTIFVVFFMGSILREYWKEFKYISDMIEEIKQGNELPKLEELGKRKKNRV